MKRQQAEAVLNRFFEECGETVPAQGDIEPVLDRVWERLEWKADEFVEARMPVAPARPFRVAWAAGLVLVVVLVNALVWRVGPPFSVARKTVDDPSMSRFSSQRAGETLPVTVPQDAFELVSVKLLAPSSEAARSAKTSEEFGSLLTGCSGGYSRGAQIDPGRLSIPAASIVGLIITAYGLDCTLVEGGPGWARSGEYYEVNALLPAGTPSYTARDLQNGNAPGLQRMLQNLLADRFRLVLKHEFREMPVYALTVVKPGKMKLSSDETLPPPEGFPSMPGMPAQWLVRGQLINSMSFSGAVHMAGHAIAMSHLARNLRSHSARLVVDKTELNDLFDVELKFVAEVTRSIPLPPGFTPPTPTPESVPPLPLPSLRDAVAELGLKLETTRMPIEVLVIESVERPSEN